MNYPNLATALGVVVGIATLGSLIFALAKPRQKKRTFTFLGVIIAIVLILAVVYIYNLLSGPASSRNVALIPVGSLIYSTDAPGDACDKHGAQWWRNTNTTSATEQCTDGGLAVSEPICNCPLEVVGLQSLPSGNTLPDNDVAEVTAKYISSGPTAQLGLKFRQQSAGDDSPFRGGYSFLIDPSGQSQFNRYTPNGAVEGAKPHLSASHFPNGQSHILDLVVNGASFSFYIDGKVANTAMDATYSVGYFCLAIWPGSTVLFSHLSLYHVPS